MDTMQHNDFKQNVIIELFLLSDSARCVRFYYAMYGGSVGTLRMYKTTTAVPSRTEIWVKTGDQGDQWFEVNIDLAAEAGLKVIIRFPSGTSLYVCCAMLDVWLHERYKD